MLLDAEMKHSAENQQMGEMSLAGFRSNRKESGRKWAEEKSRAQALASPALKLTGLGSGLVLSEKGSHQHSEEHSWLTFE